jgi:hypothetical protein
MQRTLASAFKPTNEKNLLILQVEQRKCQFVLAAILVYAHELAAADLHRQSITAKAKPQYYSN